MLGVKLILFMECALCMSYFEQASAQIDLSINEMEDELNTAMNRIAEGHIGNGYSLLTNVDDTPISENVNFRCIHRDRKQFQIVAFTKSDIEAKLAANKKTFFFIHDWSYYCDELIRLLRAASHYMDFNACLVCWINLSHYEYNISARVHAPKVGDYVASFIKELSDIGIGPELVSLAGIGMGAHIAGYAGQALNGSVAEIYGLDPTGPLFTFPVLQDAPHRLSPDDAQYVQTIITTEGELEPLGHENFYPDGGISPQPVCSGLATTTGPDSIATYLCSHQHSASLLQSAFDPKNLFTADKCDSFASFLAEDCSTNEVDLMGPYSARKQGNFYLITTAVVPYV